MFYGKYNRRRIVHRFFYKVCCTNIPEPNIELSEEEWQEKLLMEILKLSTDCILKEPEDCY
jgi:hypothetical protein